jgi:hypothetical protein
MVMQQSTQQRISTILVKPSKLFSETQGDNRLEEKVQIIRFQPLLLLTTNFIRLSPRQCPILQKTLSKLFLISKWESLMTKI